MQVSKESCAPSSLGRPTVLLVPCTIRVSPHCIRNNQMDKDQLAAGALLFADPVLPADHYRALDIVDVTKPEKDSRLVAA